jgi:hypothetical protein
MPAPKQNCSIAGELSIGQQALVAQRIVMGAGAIQQQIDHQQHRDRHHGHLAHAQSNGQPQTSPEQGGVPFSGEVHHHSISSNKATLIKSSITGFLLRNSID